MAHSSIIDPTCPAPLATTGSRQGSTHYRASHNRYTNSDSRSQRCERLLSQPAAAVGNGLSAAGRPPLLFMLMVAVGVSPKLLQVVLVLRRLHVRVLAVGKRILIDQVLLGLAAQPYLLSTMPYTSHSSHQSLRPTYQDPVMLSTSLISQHTRSHGNIRVAR